MGVPGQMCDLQIKQQLNPAFACYSLGDPKPFSDEDSTL